MKNIERIDEAIRNKEKKSWKELGYNSIFGMAYMEGLDTGNELLNFSESMWTQELDEILKNCRQEGITEFTISNSGSGLMESLEELEARGCRMEAGLVTINTTYTDYKTGKRKKGKAIRMTIN